MDYSLNGGRFVPLSDVDGLLDAHGKGWILYECKHGDSMPPLGQKIMIQRLIDDVHKGGKAAIAMVCSHGDGDAVFLKDCFVTAFYMSGKGWMRYGRDYKQQWTAKELTDRFLKKYAAEMIDSG